MKEETLLKWNLLTSARTPFGYLTTKTPVLKRLVPIHLPAHMCLLTPGDQLLDRGHSASPDRFVDTKSACTGVLGEPSTKSSKSMQSFSKSIGVHLSKWPNLPYTTLPLTTLNFADKDFDAETVALPSLAQYLIPQEPWSIAREHVPGLPSQSSSCARDPPHAGSAGGLQAESISRPSCSPTLHT